MTGIVAERCVLLGVELPEVTADGESPARTKVDADAELLVRVTATGATDEVTGSSIRVADMNGNECARATLEAIEDADEAVATADLVVRLPLDPGRYVYRVSLADSSEPNEIALVAEPVDIELEVTAHAERVHLWSIPPVVLPGQHFSFKLGVKCSQGCNLAGHEFRLLDADGAEMMRGHLGVEPWHGTASLYFAEVEAMAPSNTGAFAWSVETLPSGQDIPHCTGKSNLPVRVGSPPETEIVIEAIDSNSHLPIAGLTVMVHPYRATTDDNGVARIKVARGAYALHVSGRKYNPFRTHVRADDDLMVRAEMVLEDTSSPYLTYY